MKKNFILIAFCMFGFVACGGQSMLDQNQNLSTAEGAIDANTLALQVEIGPRRPVNNLEIPDYQIQLTQASLVVAYLKSTTTEATNPAIRLNHGGEDHSSEDQNTSDDGHNSNHVEPSTCNYVGSLNAAIYIDLTRSTHLPCVKLPKGQYTGIEFSFVNPEDLTVLGAPEGLHGTIHMEGFATHVTTHEVYPFHMRADLVEDFRISSPLDLSVNHHIEVKVDLESWFHGFQFDLLEQSEGKILLDAAHNVHRFEHMLEHMRESFSLGSLDD